jgi:hypothetical protein
VSSRRLLCRLCIGHIGGDVRSGVEAQAAAGFLVVCASRDEAAHGFCLLSRGERQLFTLAGPFNRDLIDVSRVGLDLARYFELDDGSLVVPDGALPAGTTGDSSEPRARRQRM